MANELVHGSVGTELTQAEWEAVGTHVLNSQAAGDIIYASSTSQLSRLGKGADNTVMHLASGIPAWSATLAGLTLTTPTISATGFANANHAHAASNSGGTLTTLGTITTGVWQGTDVGVAYGGTGVSTLTDGGVLLGSGASAITAMAVLTDGQMIVGDGSTDPVAESGATLRTSIGVGTGDAVEFAGITGTTIDATTDFTIGATVITDGVLTDTGGFQIAAALDMANNAISNVGAAGNDWTTNALTLAGGASSQKIKTETTGSGVNADFEAKIPASATGNASMIFTQGSGDGSANNQEFRFAYQASVGYFRFRNEQLGADVWRNSDGDATMDCNSTWDDNAFDDEDDAMVLYRAFGVEHKQLVYEQGKQILRSNSEELISLGILRRYDDGWVGYNDQRMAPLLAGGIYQNRFRMDTQFEELDARIKKLETRS